MQKNKLRHKTPQDKFLEMNGVNLHTAKVQREILGSITTTTIISLIVAAIVKILIA